MPAQGIALSFLLIIASPSLACGGGSGSSESPAGPQGTRDHCATRGNVGSSVSNRARLAVTSTQGATNYVDFDDGSDAALVSIPQQR